MIRDVAVVVLVAILFGLTAWALSRCAPGDYITRIPPTTTTAP